MCFRPEGNTYLFVFKLGSINFPSSRHNSEGAEGKKARRKFLAWYVDTYVLAMYAGDSMYTSPNAYTCILCSPHLLRLCVCWKCAPGLWAEKSGRKSDHIPYFCPVGY